MKKYIVVFFGGGEEYVVGRHTTLKAAQRQLRSIRYYPAYSRTEESLDIDEDGMSGSGCDDDGPFTYTIKPEKYE